MKIIVGAMKEELVELIKDLNAVKVNDSIIDEYVVESKALVIGITKIGLVNASTGLSYLLTKYQDQKIEWIMNIGTSGTSLVEAKQGDVLLVNQATYLLADATGFGYVYGQIPQMPEVYQSDVNLMENVSAKLKTSNLGLVLTTNIGSSDMFVNSLEKSSEFNDRLGIDVQTFDMEATAYFQTAFRFHKPMMAIKVVSDTLFVSDDNELQFDQFLPIAAKKISEIIQVII